MAESTRSGPTTRRAGDDVFRVSSTIVAANTAPPGPDLGENAEPGLAPFNVGFSLIQNPAGATITEDPPGSNITGVDAQLGPLANNGGARPRPTSRCSRAR